MAKLNSRETIKKLVSVYISIVVFVVFSIVLYIYRTQIVYLLGSFPGLLGFFVLSFISCLSIAPIPYIPIVFKVARYVDILPISIVVGMGSALGEAVAWGIGRASTHFLYDTIYFRRINTLLKFIQKRGSWTMPFLAFLFSFTFLPDKILYLPLGMMRYSLWRILPFTILGKIFMVYLVSVLGRVWATYVEGYTNEEMSFLITTVALIIVTVLMIYIDWEKLLQRFSR
ncbi:MAG: hypothetical protein QXD67_02575 [Ignisphaera sp.]